MENVKGKGRKKSTQAGSDEPAAPGILETAAQAIGSTLGSIAVKTGMVQEGAPQPATPKKSKKLMAKGKQRLPRKLKKQLQKKGQKADTQASR